MTTTKTTPSVPIGAQRTDASIVVLKKIYLIPVFRDEEIKWFDMYDKVNGIYYGKKFTMKECEEYDAKV